MSKSNHLPRHGGPAIYAIDEDLNHLVIRESKEVRIPLVAFHARLEESGLIKEKHDCVECTTYQGGYEILRRNIQKLMNQGILQISRAKGDKDTSTVG